MESPIAAGYDLAPQQPQIFVHPVFGHLVNATGERCDSLGRLTRARGSSGSGRSWGKGKGSRRDGPPQAAWPKEGKGSRREGQPQAAWPKAKGGKT